MIQPPAVRPGDHIAVIAPSGPFDRALVLRGLGWLSERYHVTHGESLFAREGFLAGTDARRLAELNDALRNPAIRAIVAARGGYGLTRIAHAADMGALRRLPKWVVGFSDVTALHVEAASVGVASLHGHNLAGLGRGDAAARAELSSALESPGTSRRFSGLSPWCPGRASGRWYGGNLTVLHACAAAGRLTIPAGSVLLLEDVSEAPYRVDRMLSGLIACGAFDGVVGVVVGEFLDCPPGRYGVPVEHVLRERLGSLGVPVVAGFPSGHGRTNVPVMIGGPVTVDARAGTIEG